MSDLKQKALEAHKESVQKRAERMRDGDLENERELTMVIKDLYGVEPTNFRHEHKETGYHRVWFEMDGMPIGAYRAGFGTGYPWGWATYLTHEKHKPMVFWDHASLGKAIEEMGY